MIAVSQGHLLSITIQEASVLQAALSDYDGPWPESEVLTPREKRFAEECVDQAHQMIGVLENMLLADSMARNSD